MGKKRHMSEENPAERASTVVDSRSGSAAESQREAGQRNENPPSPGPGDATQGGVELQAAQDEAQANFARYQRLAADFENYKRRTRQELADRTQFANEELLTRLLPVLDNFRRALAHAPENIDRNWFEGIRLVARQFEDMLLSHCLSDM